MPRVRTWLSRASPLGPVWFDVLVAGALAVYAQLDVWTELSEERVPGPRLVGAVGLLQAMLVVSSLAADERLNFYPSFAKHPAEFVEDAVAELRRAGDARTAIYPLGDEELRAALRDVNEQAAYQAAVYRSAGRPWRYQRFQDARTWMFIRDGGVWEDWQVPGWQQ